MQRSRQFQPVVIFDLDGTLFDTPRAIVEAFTYTFNELQEEIPQHRNIRCTIGMPLEKAFASLMELPVEHERVDNAVQEYQRQFRQRILPKAEELLFAGVTEGLDKLLEQGMALSVATSKFARSANALLESAKIDRYFDIVVCADEVTNTKPHPESGYKVLDHYKANVDAAIMVGDTTHDMLMAKAMGCAGLAVTYGVHTPETLRTSDPKWLVDSFDQVTDVILQHFSVSD
ncbi:HAD family hydrolase [Paraneptunicella aestuarii]|uniref:HAD family hydrolase n=1 Tax=Paraneptunicella aestuarii TaxID=2831148 RepID=UPI001E3F939E|nr:HAD family hydrolase [Paraneptunicella aestuarii]UAA38142.1 HAD family hydrolase [Paraneptunicella aestuarii]